MFLWVDEFIAEFVAVAEGLVFDGSLCEGLLRIEG